MAPPQGGLYILSPSAAYAWHLLCVTGQDIGKATRDFAEHFAIPIGTAAHDLQVTFSEWEQTVLAPIPPDVPAVQGPPLKSLPPHLYSRVYHLWGKNIAVTLDDPDLIAEICPRLEPLLALAVSVPDATLHATVSSASYHVFSDTTWLYSESHPADARVVFLQEFVRIAQGSSKWAAILHAGACGTEQRCIIFPAISRSGKTTLAAALMYAGFTFYADDSVVLERHTLTVAGMPFALMIREGSWPAVSSRFPEFENVRIHERYGESVRFLPPTSSSSNEGAEVVAIVFTRWESGVSTVIQPLGPTETLLRLNETGVRLEPDRDNIQKVLDWIQLLPSYEMIYSDLDEAAALLRKLL